MGTNWEVTLEVKSLPKLHKPILIEGLPGIGNVGKITADFLVDQFKAKKLYSFFSHKFPHSVFVSSKGIVEVPKLDIYYKTFNGKKPDLLILVGDIQPIDEESCYSFCEEILKIAKVNQCTEIITTGGIGLETAPENVKVFCTANDETLLKAYTKKGFGVQRDIFGMVGPIVGVSGILLGLGRRRGIKGVGLLAETLAHPLYLGIKGAKEILRVIDKKHNYGINLKKMNKDIIEMEKDVLRKTQEWSEPSKLAHKEINYIG